MSKSTDWDKIAAYLAGSMSAEERQNFENWISESSDHALMVKEAQLIWNNSGKKRSLPEDETDALWLRLQKNIESESSKSKIKVFIADYATPLKVAAAIALLIVSYFILPIGKEDHGELLSVASGDQVKNFYLPDSSEVWLNVNSSISYTSNFQERSISLKGEAFFKVTHDTRHPFIVSTGVAETRVLGTQFNVKEDGVDKITVTVVEGKVRFDVRDNNFADSSVLMQNEQADYSKGKNISKSKVDSKSVALWRDANYARTLALEKEQALRFISTTFVVKKNVINQTVIDGAIVNSASYATYAKIVLAIQYTKANGKEVTLNHEVNTAVKPGEKIAYRRKLPDVLSGKKPVKVTISAVTPAE